MVTGQAPERDERVNGKDNGDKTNKKKKTQKKKSKKHVDKFYRFAPRPASTMTLLNEPKLCSVHFYSFLCFNLRHIFPYRFTINFN